MRERIFILLLLSLKALADCPQNTAIPNVVDTNSLPNLGIELEDCSLPKRSLKGQIKTCNCAKRNIQAVTKINPSFVAKELTKEELKPYAENLSDKVKIAILNLMENASSVTRVYQGLNQKVPNLETEAPNCILPNSLGSNAKTPVYSCNSKNPILSEDFRKNLATDTLQRFNDELILRKDPKAKTGTSGLIPRKSSGSCSDISDDFIAFTKQKSINRHLNSVIDLIKEQVKSDPNFDPEKELKSSPDAKVNLLQYISSLNKKNESSTKASKDINFIEKELTNSPIFKNMINDETLFKTLISDIKNDNVKNTDDYTEKLFNGFIDDHKKSDLKNLNKQCKDITDSLHKALCADANDHLLPGNIKEAKKFLSRLETGEEDTDTKSKDSAGYNPLIRYNNSVYLENYICSPNPAHTKKEEDKTSYDQIANLLSEPMSEDFKNVDNFKAASQTNHKMQFTTYKNWACEVFPQKPGQIPTKEQVTNIKNARCQGEDSTICSDYIDHISKVLYGDNLDGKGGLFQATKDIAEEKAYSSYIAKGMSKDEARAKAKEDASQVGNKISSVDLMETFKNWQSGNTPSSNIQDQLFIRKGSKAKNQVASKVPSAVNDNLNRSIGTPTGTRKSSSHSTSNATRDAIAAIKNANFSNKPKLKASHGFSKSPLAESRGSISSSGNLSTASPINYPTADSSNNSSSAVRRASYPTSSRKIVGADGFEMTSQDIEDEKLIDQNLMDQDPYGVKKNNIFAGNSDDGVDTSYQDKSLAEKSKESYNNALGDKNEANKNYGKRRAASGVSPAPVSEASGGSSGSGGSAMPGLNAQFGTAKNGVKNKFDAEIVAAMEDEKNGFDSTPLQDLKTFLEDKKQKEFLITKKRTEEEFADGVYGKDQYYRAVLKKNCERGCEKFSLAVVPHISSNQADEHYEQFLEELRESNSVKNNFDYFIKNANEVVNR